MATVALSNTSANLSGKTAVLAENDQTITGLQTFNRGIGAPFAVNLGSAQVDNLLAARATNATNADNANLLDGVDGAAYAKVDTVPPLYATKAWTQLNQSIPAGYTQYNWAPGIVGNTIIYLNLAGGFELTGLVSTSTPFIGQRVRFVNVGVLGPTVTFYHEHVFANEGNKFHIRQGVTVPLSGYWGVAEFQYSIFPVTAYGGWVLNFIANGTT